jgi:hypothetical protein
MGDYFNDNKIGIHVKLNINFIIFLNNTYNSYFPE